MKEVKITCPHCSFINHFDSQKTALLPDNRCIFCNKPLNYQNDIEKDIKEGKVPRKILHIIPNPDDLEEIENNDDENQELSER